MRPVFLLMGLLSGAAAAYLAWDRGAADLLAVGAMLLAVLGLALFQLTPPSRTDVGLRPSERPAGGAETVVTTQEPSKRRPAARARRAPTPAERQELAELAGNLGAAALRRGRATEGGIAGNSHADLYLLSAGQNQIAVIKTLRAQFGYGLKEAKDLTDEARKGHNPAIARQVPTERARHIARELANAGGRVELR